MCVILSRLTHYNGLGQAYWDLLRAFFFKQCYYFKSIIMESVMRQQKIHEAVILANGEKFDASRLAALIQNRILLVLDGAYQFAHQMGLPVDYLMGDFD